MSEVPFAAAAISLATYLTNALTPAPGIRQFVSDIAVKPFQPIVTDWVDLLHDAVGGDE